MIKVTFIDFAGETHPVEVPSGTTLMRAATDNRVPGIDGDCVVNCACATCHVYVDPSWRAKTGEQVLRWKKRCSTWWRSQAKIRALPARSR